VIVRDDVAVGVDDEPEPSPRRVRGAGARPKNCWKNGSAASGAWRRALSWLTLTTAG